MPEYYDAQERADPQERERTLFESLAAALARARAGQPFWAECLADIDPATVTKREALATLPVLRKSDLPAIQAETPPFGGLATVPPGKLSRLFLSPGPICDPEGHGRDWWGSARALFAAGLRQGEVVLNTFSYHLTPAAAIFESGAHTLGCAVIPAGPGNTADQLTAIEQFRPSFYVGTPDFLKIILDKAAEDGRDAGSIRNAVVSGAALPDSLRQELAGRGVEMRQCFGTADLGVVAYEADGPGLVVNEGLIVEIVQPGTGQPVADGEVGEMLVTRLTPEYPLFRFATGDLSAVLTVPAPDGRTNMRIRGWLGRADQATKVKGMFVRPEQIAAVAAAVPGTGRLRLVVTREGEQDRMELRAEHVDAGAEAPLAAKLAEITRLNGTVTLLPPGSLPNDGKVIVDERNAG
ncbi:MAG: phenylacetate--CoA ligase family protein [Dichotomicrobium sp.]